MQRQLIFSVLVTIGLVGLLPTGAPLGDTDLATAAGEGNDTETILIAGAALGSAFVLPVVEVQAGDSIVWENLDPAFRHTASDQNGAWDTGVINPGESSASISFPTPGEYVYQCNVHPQTMLGLVQVS